MISCVICQLIHPPEALTIGLCTTQPSMNPVRIGFNCLMRLMGWNTDWGSV